MDSAGHDGARNPFLTAFWWSKTRIAPVTPILAQFTSPLGRSSHHRTLCRSRSLGMAAIFVRYHVDPFSVETRGRGYSLAPINLPHGGTLSMRIVERPEVLPKANFVSETRFCIRLATCHSPLLRRQLNSYRVSFAFFKAFR